MTGRSKIAKLEFEALTCREGYGSKTQIYASSEAFCGLKSIFAGSEAKPCRSEIPNIRVTATLLKKCRGIEAYLCRECGSEGYSCHGE